MKAPPWLLAPAGTLEPGRSVRLDADETRHASSALRLQPADRVTLTDGAGSVAAATIVSLARGGAEVAVEEVERVPQPAPGLEIAIGVLAGPAMDTVIQKSVELGVERVIPVSSARSQLSLDRAGSRRRHWRRVAAQAHKQCHRAWSMAVAEPVGLDDLIERVWASGARVADRLGAAAATVAGERARRLLVGPEGGLDPGERRQLDAAGWPGVSFGDHVLRAETAAIAGAVAFAIQRAAERRHA